MTTMQRVAYGIGGFGLSLFTALLTAAGLQILIAHVIAPPSGFLVAYGSSVAIVITAITATWVWLLQSLKNEAMIRGVWCHIYTFVAIAAVSIVLSLVL